VADISVQRGTTVANVSGSTQAITAVSSLSSAFARNLCNRRHSGGSNVSGGNMECDDISCALRLTATDTITFERISTAGFLDVVAAWEVWEYTGSPGGANEFIVRGRYQLTMGNGTRTASTAVSGVVDHNRCIAFIGGYLCDHTTDAADSITGTAYVDSSNNLQVDKGGNNAETVSIWVTVVEFTGSNWTVHHGRQEGGGSAVDSGTIALRDESNGTGGSTSSVSDWANAAIFHQFRANLLAEEDDSIADTSAVYYPGGTNGTVTYQHDANHVDSASAGSRNLHHVNVLENADLSVSRYTDTQNAAGVMNVNITSAGLTDLSASALEVSRHSSGNGTAYMRGWVIGEISSLTNVELQCHRSGNAIQSRIQVLDLSAIEDSGGSVSPVSGSSAGSATSSATCGGSGELAASAPCSSSSGASLLGRALVSASSSGIAAAIAAILGLSQASATSDGTSSVSAGAFGTGQLAYSDAGSTSVVAGISATAQIFAESAGVSTATATSGASSAVSGSSDGLSSASALLEGVGAVSGLSEGTSSALAQVQSDGDLVASVEGACTTLASIQGRGELIAGVEGTSGQSASLFASGLLAGQSHGASSAQVEPSAASALAGASDGLSGSAATLGGIAFGEYVDAGSSAAGADISGFGALHGATECDAESIVSLIGIANASGVSPGTSIVVGSAVPPANTAAFAPIISVSRSNGPLSVARSNNPVSVARSNAPRVVARPSAIVPVTMSNNPITVEVNVEEWS
jgi:hypothetical protein